MNMDGIMDQQALVGTYDEQIGSDYKILGKNNVGGDILKNK